MDRREMMINLTADKARQVTEEGSQTFKRELIDRIESDIIYMASEGYNEVVTTKFVHSSSLLVEKYREDIQSVKNQLVKAGYKVDVRENDVSKFVDNNVKIKIRVSW